MGGRVVLVRARKLRPGMRLKWSHAEHAETILEVDGGWVRVDGAGLLGWSGWYSLWALLDRMRDGDLEVVR